MDLLEHKVLKAALFRRLYVPVYMHGFLFMLAAIQIIEGYAVRRHLGDLVFIHQIYVARILQNRRNIRRQYRTVRTLAHDQLAVLTRAVDGIRLILAHDAERIAALDHRDHLADGAQHITVVIVTQQVRHYLGIRFAAELIALVKEHFLEL